MFMSDDGGPTSALFLRAFKTNGQLGETKNPYKTRDIVKYPHCHPSVHPFIHTRGHEREIDVFVDYIMLLLDC